MLRNVVKFYWDTDQSNIYDRNMRTDQGELSTAWSKLTLPRFRRSILESLQ